MRRSSANLEGRFGPKIRASLAACVRRASYLLHPGSSVEPMGFCGEHDSPRSWQAKGELPIWSPVRDSLSLSIFFALLFVQVHYQGVSDGNAGRAVSRPVGLGDGTSGVALTSARKPKNGAARRLDGSDFKRRQILQAPGRHLVAASCLNRVALWHFPPSVCLCLDGFSFLWNVSMV